MAWTFPGSSTAGCSGLRCASAGAERWPRLHGSMAAASAARAAKVGACGDGADSAATGSGAAAAGSGCSRFSAATRSGLYTSARLPLPTWPCWFDPHAKISPVDSSARLWDCPLAAARTLLRLGSRTGSHAFCCCCRLRPHWPSPFSPQHISTLVSWSAEYQSGLSRCSAMVKSSPQVMYVGGGYSGLLYTAGGTCSVGVCCMCGS
mmetsp:Transcript_8133/g.22024  ORF Transcript_8133/g.22024 Transcript_8133/m.22024 type:complete len:206 (+) Transcript_8133:259-876(+)